MVKKQYLYAVVMAASLAGCTIEKRPYVPQAPATGQIYVSAQDPYDHALLGGAIYLDGILQQGKNTPDTIEAEAGNHYVAIEVANFFADSSEVSVYADSVVGAVVILDPVNPDVGSVMVSAQDSALATDLSGGEIFLDGASTGLTCPDTLNNTLVGIHTVGVGILGHDYRATVVDVAAGLSLPASLALPQVPWNGIRIETDIAAANVCIDERLYASVTPWTVSSIPDGLHTFSCYKENHATLNDPLKPALQTAELFAYGYQALSFSLELWPAGTGSLESKLALPFSLLSDQGDSVALGGLRGHVVLLNFWFRDCQPCMEEMPDIQQVYEELAGSGFRVLALNPMFNDELQDLLDVRALLGLTFKLLMDQDNSQITQSYNAYPFPVNILIDRRGVIDWRTGSIDYAGLKARVQALLNP